MVVVLQILPTLNQENSHVHNGVTLLRQKANQTVLKAKLVTVKVLSQTLDCAVQRNNPILKG